MLKMRKAKVRKGEREREKEKDALCKLTKRPLTDFGRASNEISVKSEVLRGASGKCESEMASLVKRERERKSGSSVTSYPEAGTETAT